MNTDEMLAAMKPQSDEFDAMDALAKEWRRVQMTPIVDDDYPEVRHAYEGAVRTFLTACKANGRQVAAESKVAMSMNLEHIGEISLQRVTRWHEGGIDDWTPERWVTAIVGELGEMANITKKLFRIADGMVGSTESVEELEQKEADEWADTMLYMILFALRRRINMTAAIVEVFNRKSEQLGFPERL
jgi:NTP pyrophosphatase (non-canonical NTP hydrolase)